MKCLIADDDPLICETLETYLQQLGGVDLCLKVGDGVAALQLTQSERFDVLFLDLQMPTLDGVDVNDQENILCFRYSTAASAVLIVILRAISSSSKSVMVLPSSTRVKRLPLPDVKSSAATRDVLPECP